MSKAAATAVDVVLRNAPRTIWVPPVREASGCHHRCDGLCSARPQDLARLAGRPVPEGGVGTCHPLCRCDGFVRVRPFPRVGLDGPSPEVRPASGSPPACYIPAGVILADPSFPLVSQKVRSRHWPVTQAGFPTRSCGVWNFRRGIYAEDGLIPDLELVRWDGRPTNLAPDSGRVGKAAGPARRLSLGSGAGTNAGRHLVLKIPWGEWSDAGCG